MFTIDYATKNDIPDIMAMIKTAMELLPDPDWFVDDTEEFFTSHIEKRGFTLKAIPKNEITDTQENITTPEKIAAFFTIRFPKHDEDNLGYAINLNREELLKVAHMETAVVHPDYRGNHLEQRLMAEAVKILKNTPHCYLMGTVHPDNTASVKSFLNNGFSIEETVPKYGGRLRHIMLKKLR